MQLTLLNQSQRVVLRKRQEEKVGQVVIGRANIMYMTQTKLLPEHPVLFPFASFLK